MLGFLGQGEEKGFLNVRLIELVSLALPLVGGLFLGTFLARRDASDTRIRSIKLAELGELEAKLKLLEEAWYELTAAGCIEQDNRRRVMRRLQVAGMSVTRVGAAGVKDDQLSARWIYLRQQMTMEHFQLGASIPASQAGRVVAAMQNIELACLQLRVGVAV